MKQPSSPFLLDKSHSTKLIRPDFWFLSIMTHQFSFMAVNIMFCDDNDIEVMSVHLCYLMKCLTVLRWAQLQSYGCNVFKWLWTAIYIMPAGRPDPCYILYLTHPDSKNALVVRLYYVFRVTVTIYMVSWGCKIKNTTKIDYMRHKTLLKLPSWEYMKKKLKKIIY